MTPQQLAIREGQVRCGHCQTVFDGNANMISLAPQPRGEPGEGEQDEAALGPPTVTLRSAQALKPAVAAPTSAPAAAPLAMPAAPAEDVDEIAYEERFAWSKRKRKRRAGVLVAVAFPRLLMRRGAQVALHYRDWIAAPWPAWKPVLARMCDPLGCEVHALRDIGAVSIEASDLQADPAHKGLLILTATLRNQAPWPIAYPSLELTLTDAQDRTVVRRALAPADYAGNASADAGIGGNGEVPVKLFIDASATTQSGYRLFLFYP